MIAAIIFSCVGFERRQFYYTTLCSPTRLHLLCQRHLSRPGFWHGCVFRDLDLRLDIEILDHNLVEQILLFGPRQCNPPEVGVSQSLRGGFICPTVCRRPTSAITGCCTPRPRSAQTPSRSSHTPLSAVQYFSPSKSMLFLTYTMRAVFFWGPCSVSCGIKKQSQTPENDIFSFAFHLHFSSSLSSIFWVIPSPASPCCLNCVFIFPG